MQREMHPLRIARQQRNLSQQALADFCGVGVSTIERAERGDPIRADTRKRICAFLGKDAIELGLLPQIPGKHGITPFSPPEIAVSRRQRPTFPPTWQQEMEMNLIQLWDDFHLAQNATDVALLRLAVHSFEQQLALFESSFYHDDPHAWWLRMMSEYAILMGRIDREQMNYGAAISWHQQAVTLAYQSGDHTQIVAASMRLAETFRECGLLSQAIECASAGIAIKDAVSPRVRGELLGLTAIIELELGHMRDSEQHIEESAQLAIGAVHLPTAGGINFSQTALASYQMAVALHRDTISEALAYIHQGRQLLPMEFPGNLRNLRWEIYLWIDQAHAFAQAHDKNATMSALHEAGTLTKQIQSWKAFQALQATTRHIHHLLPVPLIRSWQEELRTISW